MVYAYDRAIPLPVKDLYDTQVMAMSINAAKDMYEKGQKQIDDFYNKYGDFMSPFAKDMERYGQIVGGLRDIVNQAYANGVDPLRSAEGRALVAQAIRSVNPAEINAMRANAKTGYAYLDALQALRRAGKYSQEQEDFDIAQTGGPRFADFATSNGAGGFVQWDRVSPIQATTLRELTQDSYKGRTPRTLTAEDFKNDPRLAGKYAYDPRYEWTGYLDSDLMKVAPGASASLAGDPRAAFFREQARQMVIASGKVPTAENVEAQFQRNIANANDWALVDPTKKADEFAKMDYENRLAIGRENLRHKHAMDEAGAKASGGYGGGYFLGAALSGSAKDTASKMFLANNRLEEYNKLSQIKDKTKQAKEKARLEKQLVVDLLTRPEYGTGKKNIANIILSLGNGSKGVGQMNNVLSNFAVNGDNKMTGSSILESIGFYKSDNGTYTLQEGENVRILTPQQIFRNMIQHGSGDFNIHLKDGSSMSKQQLLNKLDDNINTRTEVSLWPDWMQATPSNIANRTTIVRPTATNKGIIVAPDETGVKRLYVKVQTVSNSWFDGDHNGYWVETPVTYGADGRPTMESTPLFQGSEEQEGKALGNSQRKEAFENRR